MEELRSAAFTDAEVKGMDFRGYAAVFDAPWNDYLTERMGYVEKIARGAFRKALAKTPNVPLLWQHDRRDVLATTKSGNLRIQEDGKGLLVEAKLPKNPLGEYVRSMIEAGDVGGMSYGIETIASDSKIDKRDGVVYRTLTNAQKLTDTTLTWEPAYDATSVELRNMSGFAAVPLQELVGGLEDQTGDAATERTSLEALEYRRRADDIMLAYLENGGVL